MEVLSESALAESDVPTRSSENWNMSRVFRDVRSSSLSLMANGKDVGLSDWFCRIALLIGSEDILGSSSELRELDDWRDKLGRVTL
jgi:hypothetical protein